MIREELLQVIINFDEALKKGKFPNFDKNLHRVEQVLRILQVEYHNFAENEPHRACFPEVRNLWENFWEYPDIKEDLARYRSRRAQ